MRPRTLWASSRSSSVKLDWGRARTPPSMPSDSAMYRYDCSTKSGLPSVAAWMPTTWIGESGAPARRVNILSTSASLSRPIEMRCARRRRSSLETTLVNRRDGSRSVSQ